MPKPPHIVIFNPDQWRGDVLGHTGNPAAVTPNLDRLVSTDAVSFRRAFCQNPVCTPSRCSFMSGWYPHVRGHRTMYHMMRPGEPVLLKTLMDNGYFVWWGGKNDLVPGQDGYEGFCHVKYEPPAPEGSQVRAGAPEGWRGQPGSDTYYSFYIGRLGGPEDAGRYHDQDWGYVRGAVEFIRNGPKDRPLCIYLPLGYPHPPYAVEEPFYSLIDRSKVPSTASSTGRKCLPASPPPRAGSASPASWPACTATTTWPAGPRTAGGSCGRRTTACAPGWITSSAWSWRR